MIIKSECIVVVCFVSTFLLITACESIEQTNSDANETPHPHERMTISNPEIPIQENERIEMVYGWLNSTTILYSVKKEDNELPQLMKWEFDKKNADIYFQPNANIVDVSISPNQTYILVHSASSSEKGVLDVLDIDGNPTFSATVPSVELTYEWNPFSEGELLVSSFFEDWTYQCYVMDVLQKSIEAVNVPQPFAQWTGEDELLYLDWDLDEPQLAVPLVKKAIDSDHIEPLMLGVISFKKMQNTLMVIQDQSEQVNQATYRFVNDEQKLLSSFSVPHQRGNSNEDIPFYDISEKTKKMLTFVPHEGQINSQNSDYTLQVFDWETGKKETLIEDAENLPISCSPNLNWCLYGYQYENLLHVKTKTFYSLVQKEE
jgi:hypothetical protein